MTPRRILGLILVIVGLISLLWGGISWTRERTVVDIGPIHATADRQRTIPLPPVLGITAVVGGVALLIVGLRQRA